MQNITPIATSVILGATLALSGCKDKSENTSVSAGKSVSTPFGKFKPGGKLGALKAPSAVKRDAGHASAALAAMNLQDSGSGVLTWKSREGADGNYTFSDLSLNVEGADGALTVDSLAFTGLGMDGDVTTFSSVKASGINVDAPDDEIAMTLADFTVVDPSPQLAAAIGAVLSGDKDADDLFEGGGLGFAAMSMDDLKMNIADGGEQVTMSLAGVRAGKTDTETMESFALRSLSVEGNVDGEPLKMNLDSIDVAGLNFGIYGKAFANLDNGAMGMAQLMSETNPYKQPVHTFDMRGLTGDVSGVSWDMDSAVVRTSKKGGKTLVTQITSPLTVSPSGTGDGADALREGLSMIGYDSISISTKGVTEIDEKTDRITVNEANITMKDGFVLNMDYDIFGLGAMYAAQAKYAAMDAAGEEYDYSAAQTAGVENLQIGKFGIVFNDNSFTDRVFAAAAAERGTEPDVLKAQITGLMAMGSMMAQDEAQQKLVADASAAVTTFLNDPGTFKVGLYPKSPLGMDTIEAMGNGVIDVKKLGIVIEAK